MKMPINIKSVIALVFLSILFSYCSNQEKEKYSTSQETSKMQTVEVVKPKQRSFTAEVLITGTAQPNQEVRILAMESGMLTNIRKDIGDKVKSGEIIAVLANPELDFLVDQMIANQSAKKAELSTAEADLEVAKANASALTSIADRLESVYTKTPQLTSIVQVEIAQGDAKAATAMILSQDAKVKTKEAEVLAIQVQVASAQKRKSLLQVRAPFSGIITKRLVDKGAMIQSGLNEQNPQAVVEMQQTNPIRLTLAVPESEAAAIKLGMEVKATFPEMSGEIYQAKISRTSNALDPMSKTMQVEIDLKNADGKILSGMYAKVLLQVSSRENILSLPIISKVSFKNESYILVVENGIVKRLPIKIGLSDKNYFEVLNAEITKASQVITKGKSLVNPGQIVKPQLTSE